MLWGKCLCLVAIESTGKINVWLANKTPFIARGKLAAALGVPEECIRVNAVAIGGDFSGKGSLMDSVLCTTRLSTPGGP